jgi:hypothetical protein
MAEKKTIKKTAKNSTKKTPGKKTKTVKTKKSKSTKSKSKKAKEEPFGDSGIVIVDDELEIDQEKVNEERRAYLEEARSQDASD